MGCIVAKFGGSSLATAGQMKKVAAIVRQNPDRRYIVPSAPGKAPEFQEKVTDLLYGLQRAATEQDMVTFEILFSQIEARYQAIVDGLGTQFDIHTPLQTVRQAILEGGDADYAASRGEYLNGLILADFLDIPFIDPAGGILFDANGEFDESGTQLRFSALLRRHERGVIPGFYGVMPGGRIKTFSRGGSDITGAIVARAVGADLYENWTDVSGFLMTDPRIVHNPRTISKISYRELRELSYMGASVLHEDSIFPVQKGGIPINVKNTNEPEHPGTLIVAEPDDDHGRITGIAGKKGFTIIHMEKDKMNSELGFGRRVLSVFEQLGISFEHMPSGIDTLSVVISDAQLEGHMTEILDHLHRDCRPDHIEVVNNLALIATVGHGMVRRVGIAATLFTALSEAGVNVRMIDQGSSEINIIVGVESDDFEVALRAVYACFENEEDWID
ncbi:MAG: aspartate kinase [Christensenellales bacterium]